VWGFFYTRIVFSFLSGTVDTDFVFVRWTGPTWARVIYIVAVVLSLGFMVVFDAAERWGKSLQRVQAALSATFPVGEQETVRGALTKLFGRLWRPFMLVPVIPILFVAVGAGILIVGYRMFDTGGEVKVYHVGLAMALVAMLLLVVRR
jgi:hypothetical protein